MVTNWNEIAGKWKQLGGEAKKQWGKLTDDELTKINGDREILSGTIQEKYGIAKMYADLQIDKWAEKVKHLSFKVQQKVDDISQDTIKQFVADDTKKTLPKIGQIMTYDGNEIPSRFLPCDGRMLRRDDYPTLFNLIKTEYGDADGSNTAFNLPVIYSETPNIRYIICVKSDEPIDV